MATTAAAARVDQTTNRPFLETRASVHLDAVRGIAALFVTLQHLRSIFFVPFQALTAHRALFRLPYLLASLGYQAVVIFFVLSGFLVGGTALRSFERAQWSWRRYLTHRFVRLWLVLLPALVLGALWDHATLLHVHRAGALQPAEILNGLTSRLSLRTFLGNLVFLQEIAVNYFGSNGPLWSLTNEFWYYLLFPLALLALRPARRLLQRLAYTVAFILVAWFVGNSILLLAPIWLFGALLHYAPKPSASRLTRRLSIALYPVLVLVLSHLSNNRPVAAEYLLGLATTALLWILLSARDAADPRSPVTRVSRGLARFSYTLYLVHVPVFAFAGCLLLGASPWTPTPTHLAVAALLWCSVLLYAWAVAAVTEFRTDAVRHQVERLGARLVA